MTETALSLPVDVNAIQGMLPHRYPFLLVDRVIALEPGRSITAIKNVTINEPYFQGHFPGHPVMPGVLIIEALAQASGLLVQLSGDPPEPTQGSTMLFYLVKVDKARFNRTVVPGDQLLLRVTLKRMLRGMGLFEAEALVEDSVAASCEIMCAGRAE